MNSTIFVQSTVGIPTETSTETILNPDLTKRKPAAAVIRPVHGGAQEHNRHRVDPANSKTQQHHLRTQELFAYVNWLKAKIEADLADTRPTSTNVETPVSDHVSADMPTPESSETDRGETVESTTNDSITLQDQSQSDSDSVTCTVFSEFSDSDTFFSTINAEISLLDSAMDTPTFRPEALTQTRGTPKPSNVQPHSKTEPIERADSAHPTHSVHSTLNTLAPKAHTTFVESDPMFKKDNLQGDTTVSGLSSAETEKLIATISTAIASVLTNKVDADFEEKVRSSFESDWISGSSESNETRDVNSARTQTAVSKMEGETSLHFSSQSPGPVPTNSASKTPTDTFGAKEPTQIESTSKRSSSVAEIPTDVAAWDVGDFRWPDVTNQMIVSGGESINQLLESTFEMISAGRQRIAVSGITRGDGTTTIAISLARWAAACGKRVLLVDADIAKPDLSQRVGLAPNLSWIKAIGDSQDPSETIVRSQKSNICVMPMVTTATQVIWPRCVYDNLGELLSGIQNHFDLVLLDMGPGNQLLDELSRPELLIDATLLVHDGVATSKLDNMKNRLEAFGLKKFVVTQNRATRKSVNVA